MSSVAVVKSIVGQVFAVSPEGIRRLLVEGDRLFTGELVETGPAGSVSLELADGRTLDVGRDTQWSANTPDSVTDLSAATAQAAPSVAELQQAIAAGVDPTQAFEAAAAGPTAAGADGAVGGGHSFVVLDATAGTVNPNIGYPTNGLNAADAAANQFSAATNNSLAARDVTITLTATPSITEAGGVVVYTAFITQAPTSDLTVTLSNGLSVVILAGQTSGALNVTFAGNDTPYLDASSISATIAGTSGGGNLVITTDPAPAVTLIKDTIDTTTVTLSANASVDEGGKIVYTATVSNAAQTDVTITLSNNTTITIEAGKSTGTVSVDTPANLADGKDLSISATITAASGGNYENLAINPEAATTTVVAVDNPSVLVADTNTVAEEHAATGNVLSNDSDIDNVLTVATFTVDGNTYAAGKVAFIEGVGSITIGTDGAYAFTPVKDFNGEVPQIGDTTNTGSSSTLDVTVTPVNDAPVAAVVEAGGAEDSAQGIAVKLSATDVDGLANVKSFTVGTPTNGTFYTDAAMTKPVTGAIDATNGEATVYFKPNANFNGTADFTYTATDSDNADGSNPLTSAPANGTITVTPVNDAPVAADTIASGAEDPSVGIAVKLSATDVDGLADVKSFTVGTSTNGTFYTDAAMTKPVTGSIDAVNGEATVYFKPNANFNGTANFTYTATDGGIVDGGSPLTSTPANGTINVTPVNDAPVAADTTATGAEDPTVGIAVKLSATDVDGLADVKSFTVGTPTNGTFYTDAAMTKPVTGSIDAVNGEATVYFKPNENFHGTADFTYTATDGGNADGSSPLTSAPANGTIIVTAVNDAPVAAETAATGAEDPSVGIAVKLSATDVDSPTDVKSFTVGTPTNGTFYTDAAMTKPVTGAIDAVNGEATVYFKPNADFHGTADFTYTATDGGNADGSSPLTSAPANGTIIVTAVNDAPVAAETAATGAEDPSVGIAVKLSATDVDSPTDVKSFTVGTPTNGTFYTDAAMTKPVTGAIDAVNGEATVYFKPNENFHGTANFTYTATDGGNADGSSPLTSAPANGTIIVTAVNDAPVAAETAATGAEDPSVGIAVKLSATDVDSPTDVKSFTVGTPTNGTFYTDAAMTKPVTGSIDAVNGEATVYFKPNENFNGTADFTYTATDGGNADGSSPLTSAPANGTITVTPVNDAPTASNGHIESNEDTPVELKWSTFGVNDVDSTNLKVVFTSLPNGAIEYKVDGVWVQLGAADLKTDTSAGKAFSQADFDNHNVRYSPAANESGDSSFGNTGVGNKQGDYTELKFQATDGLANSGTQTITVDIHPVTDVPVVTVGSFGDVPTGLTIQTWIGGNLPGALGTNGNGVVQSSDLIRVINAQTPGSAASTGVTANVSNGNVVELTATKVSGLIYLEAGKSYSFTGSADDSLAVTVGGKLVSTETWSQGSGINATPFTPTESGYYTLDIYHYNQNGPGNYDINVSINSGPSMALGSSGVQTYTSLDALKAAGAVFNDAHVVNGEGYYTGYVYNHGLEDSAIKISPITTTFVDNDQSESHKVEISGLPAGAVITDGATGHSYTSTGATTQYDVSNWNLGTLTVTPAKDATTNFDLTVTATAKELSTQVEEVTTGKVSVVITAVNDAPVAIATTATGAEDPSVGIAVKLSATDVDGLANVKSFNVGTSSNGTFYTDAAMTKLVTGAINAVNGEATVYFKPNANFNGTANFTYTATDSGNADGSNVLTSPAANGSITVTPVNDAPVAVATTATGAEDPSVGIAVKLSATDVDGLANVKSFTVGTPTNGTFYTDAAMTKPVTGGIDAVNGEATVYFKPNANFNGTANFTYTATDSGNADGSNVLTSPAANGSINVTPVNDAPTASNGHIESNEDTPVELKWSTFGVNDVDSTDLKVVFTSLPNGAIEYKVDGVWVKLGAADLKTDTSAGKAFSQADFDNHNVRYSPAANESGDSSFGNTGVGNKQGDYTELKFQATDGLANSGTQTITVDIHPVTDVPVVTVGSFGDVPTGLTIQTWIGGNLPGALGTNGNGVVQSSDLIRVINAQTPGSAASTGVTANVSNGNVVELTATKVSGLIYLEAGKSYSFTGSADDSLAVTVGGKLVSTETWSQGSGINATPFTPTESGYYTLDIYHYNQNGPGNYDINVSINSGPSMALGSSGVQTYTSLDALKAAGAVFNDAHVVNGEGYYTGYVYNHGLEDSAIKISPITTTFVDNDQSESHKVEISGLPAGAVITDGATGHSYTSTGATTQYDVSNWNLGTLTVTPAKDATANFDLTVTATAKELSTQVEEVTTGKVSVVITAVNDAPVAIATTATGAEDPSVGIAVKLSATDVDGLANVKSFNVGTSSNGTFYTDAAMTKLVTGAINAVNGEATVYFKPNANFNGTANFTYTATDSGNADGSNVLTSPAANGSITVTPVNDAPVAVATTATGAEDPSVGIAVKLSATDVDGLANVKSFTVGTPTNGTFYTDAAMTKPVTGGIDAVNGEATVYFKPNANFNGTANFTYTATDGGIVDGGSPLTSTPANGTITVTPVNDAPVAVATTATGAEDPTVGIAVKLSATDVDGLTNVKSFTVGTPTNGTFYTDAAMTNAVTGAINAVKGAATVYFKPNANFHGTANFTYTATDSGNADGSNVLTSPVANGSITVTPVNDSPVDAATTATGAEDPTVGIAVKLSATDVDGLANVKSFTVGTSSNGTFYTDAAMTNAVTGAINAVNGEVTVYFKPNANFNGTANFTYTATDSGNADGTNPLTSPAANGSITVTPVNDAPVAVATTATGAEDPSVGIAVKLSATDVDGLANVKSFTVGTPTNGTFYTDAAMTKAVTGTIDAVNGAATVYFKPNANFNGTANFTYTATDSGNADGSNVLTSPAANGSITVTPVNDASVAAATTATGAEDPTVGIAVKLSATDVDGLANVKSFTVGTSSNGTFYTDAAMTNAVTGAINAVNGEATVYFKPNANFNGTANFTYTATDSGNAD